MLAIRYPRHEKNDRKSAPRLRPGLSERTRLGQDAQVSPFRRMTLSCPCALSNAARGPDGETSRFGHTVSLTALSNGREPSLCEESIGSTRGMLLLQQVAVVVSRPRRAEGAWLELLFEPRLGSAERIIAAQI